VNALASFDVPVNFLVNSSDDELTRFRDIGNIDASTRQDNNLLAAITARHDLHWCLLSYRYLRQQSTLDVRLTNSILSGAINIAHTVHLESMGRPLDAFVVSIRADFHRRPWAHYHIVQNRRQVEQNTSCIYLWPQPGLIERDKSRTTVENIAYVGQTINGNLAWSAERWERLLSEHNFKFKIPVLTRWNDMNDVDAVVAVRSFDANPYNNKPPSKLINAWHAGTVFIGGADSAYRQVGKDGVNYIEARSPDAVISSLRRIREDPDYYGLLRNNGFLAARRYSIDGIRKTWMEALKGPIYERYVRWTRSRKLELVRTRVIGEIDLHANAFRRVVRGTLRT
jgi:hypothetical protein